MFSKFFLLIFIYLQIISTLDLKINDKSKNTCTIDILNSLSNYLSFTKNNNRDQKVGFKCTIIKPSNFTLDMKSFTIVEKYIKNQPGNIKEELNIEFNWPLDKKASNSLTKNFGILSFKHLVNNWFKYSDKINYYNAARVYFRNLNNIQIDLFNNLSNSFDQYTVIWLNLINSDLRFTIDGKTVKTCTEITSNFNSIFQIRLAKDQYFDMLGCHFPLPLCPLVFKNSYLNDMFIYDLIETFYKTNLVKFSNETFDDLKSTIYSLILENCENIPLETSFLHSSVFNELLTKPL